MKPMSGMEMLRRLKSDPRTTSIPVIMVSGDPMSSAMASAHNAGAAGYVMKAPTPGELRERLEAAIRTVA
jgi:CheY-like chemotaxis protein